ncbi:uncharacterized protein EI97DRAFT_384306 [Westerdykella ornata]|uniref:Malate dehydrogenase n=1 Tax=Westerdykella ornata TaxID=318751 RepID=A0A6A6JBT4_WESOR|nr:uncharacterized protein EI97DRAFT_384306 [Westerdykella ornata]KAF2273096.1 hypothetical protein EI97DRAFT_384306 [Westerdykella ornata]
MAPPTTAAPTAGVNLKPRYTTPNLERLKSMMPKSTLPAPDGLQLKFVGLGIGTQNYTCTTGVPTAEPGTTGALAKLYDIGTRLNSDPFAKAKIGTISGLALQFHNFPKLLDGYLMVQGYQRVLGDHYFTGSVPTFALNKVPANPFPLAFVKKNADADAPKSACPGTKNEGAIKWLHLIDNGNSQGGVNAVYRLETAGGNKPKTCDGQKSSFEVPYTAQYWVFGPK